LYLRKTRHAGQKQEMHRELWCGKQKETDHLRDMCSNRMIILKWIVIKRSCRLFSRRYWSFFTR